MRFILALGIVWSLGFAQLNINVGQLMLLSFEGDQPPLEQLSEFQPAGFLFYSNNLSSTENIRALTQTLQNAAAYPLLFGVNQEGGPANAYRVDQATLFSGQMALAATGDPELATQVAKAIGSELGYMGLNLLFGPVLDVNSNPDNPIIGVRSFGADADLVTTFAKAYAEGLKQAGIAAVAKHFPGHGDTVTDSHLSLPKVTGDLERLHQVELAPFKAMIEADVPAIMSAHVVFAALDNTLPATLSPSVLTGLLREQLGFKGVVITDAMDMKAISDNYGAGEAAVQSIVAGADLLLLGPDLEKQREVYAALVQALETGRLTQARVREAITHSQTLASTYPPVWGSLPDYAAHQALAQDVAIKAATLLLNDGVLPLKVDDKVLVLAPRLMEYGEPPLLGDVLSNYHPHVTSLRINPEPTEQDIQQALELSLNADVIVLASHHWQGDFSQSLVSLESALVVTGKPVVIVALGNPDDLRFFDPPNAYLAIYSFWEANLFAASKVLVGQAFPYGKLPVPVGRFPIGSGMNGF